MTKEQKEKISAGVEFEKWKEKTENDYVQTVVGNTNMAQIWQCCARKILKNDQKTLTVV